MSKVGQENGDPESEENPDPEEDSDWMARPVNGNELARDEPESYSGFSACLDSNSQADLHSEEIVGNVNCEYQNCDVGDCQPSHSIEGVSFEQAEDGTAPESESSVEHQACSESDQMMNHQNTDECKLTVSEDAQEQTSQIKNNIQHESEGPSGNANSSVQPSVSDQLDGSTSAPAFNGDVEVEPGPEYDAPEDEIRLNIKRLCNIQEAMQPTENTSQQNVYPNDVEGGCNLLNPPSQGDIVTALNSVRAESNSSMEGDKDSQTPECDRDTSSTFQNFCDISLKKEQESPFSCNSSSTGVKEENNEIKTLKENVKVDDSLKESHCDVPHLAAVNEIPDEKCSSNDIETYSSSLRNEISEKSILMAASQTKSHSEQLHTMDTMEEHSHSVKSAVEQSQSSDSQTSSISSSPSISSSEKQTFSIPPSGHQRTQSPEDVSSSLSSNCAVIPTSHVYHHSPKTEKAEASAPSPAKPNSNDITKQLELVFGTDEDDDDDIDKIMLELDAELSSRCSDQHSIHKKSPKNKAQERGDSALPVNGILVSDIRQLQDHNRQLLQQLKIRDDEISNMRKKRESMIGELSRFQAERDDALKKLSTSSNHNADDIYLPQIVELEKTIAEQQNDLRISKEKLASHDNAAKKAVTTLQNELKCRVDQITKLYEEAIKDKDAIVVNFATSESKAMENKKLIEKQELKLKEAAKDREQMNNALKAAKSDKQKALFSLELKSNEVVNIQKELEKMKEAISSGDYRIRWFQNKLKDELEAHKETKANLEKTTSRLKEAKEETEIIRKECQAIVKTYQESEEIKSNSLDKELKIKESQLKLQMQEFNDTEEIHQKTKKELESIKVQHKDKLQECKDLKQKITGVEESIAEKEMLIGQLQETLNKQKVANTHMQEKISTTENLEEDFSRAQEMIKSLDKDVAELKITNRDLQKDMESCRERESKMLALQSELSKTNALLRSENTNLSNKACNLTAEVEKLKMEVQELETTVSHMADSFEEEKKKKSEEINSLKVSLDKKTKESEDYKQKWEDEMDSSKTLKRRHANNIKDLTRQLHHAKRKLENVEGSKDAGSMGSRTNSNGSLNSVDNSSSHNQSTSFQAHPQQEFPVITEQVEVDKHVLIERIVRLQKSHARKTEKLEFLSEHIHQLLEEIKKKNRIIQSYILREEAGTLSSEDMDANKTLLARKGGIMASVYSLHQQDGHMTLELSLQINKKLQAVLEDTLLKNITLKENLDTLGEEIARLSQENRKLQLHLHDIETASAGRKVLS